MGAMQNYVMHCDVRSWRASGVMFDKTHCDRRSNNDWQDPLLVLVDEYLVDFLLKDKGVVERCLRSCPGQVQEVELGGLLLRDRGAKASGLTEGIRASAQVEFCFQPGANVCSPEIVTMNFVQETLPNLIIRPLLLVTRVPSPWNVQTVACLSPSFLPVQRNHSNLPLPPFFFLEVSSLSLSLLPSTSFFIPQCQGFHTENTSNNKDKSGCPNIYLFSFTRIAWSSFFCWFFLLPTKVSEYCSS